MLETAKPTGNIFDNKVELQLKDGNTIPCYFPLPFGVFSVPLKEWFTTNKDNLIAVVGYVEDNRSNPIVFGFFPIANYTPIPEGFEDVIQLGFDKCRLLLNYHKNTLLIEVAESILAKTSEFKLESKTVTVVADQSKLGSESADQPYVLGEALRKVLTDLSTSLSIFSTSLSADGTPPSVQAASAILEARMASTKASIFTILSTKHTLDA